MRPQEKCAPLVPNSICSALSRSAWLSIIRTFQPASLNAPPKPSQARSAEPSLTVTVAAAVLVARVPLVFQYAFGAEVITLAVAVPVPPVPAVEPPLPAVPLALVVPSRPALPLVPPRPALPLVPDEPAVLPALPVVPPPPDVPLMPPVPVPPLSMQAPFVQLWVEPQQAVPQGVVPAVQLEVQPVVPQT